MGQSGFAIDRLIVNCADEAATVAIGRALANGLARATAAGTFVIYLQGTLGAGKTTLARGLLRALGVRGTVRSPTFTLVEQYETDGLLLLHIDLYRLEDPREFGALGLREHDRDGVCWLIEWPEQGAGAVPKPDLVIAIGIDGDARTVELHAFSDRAERLLQSVSVPVS